MFCHYTYTDYSVALSLDPYPKICADILIYLSPFSRMHCTSWMVQVWQIGRIIPSAVSSFLFPSFFPSNALRSLPCHVQAGIRVLPRCRVKSAYKVPHYQTNIHTEKVDKVRINWFHGWCMYTRFVQQYLPIPDRAFAQLGAQILPWPLDDYLPLISC